MTATKQYTIDGLPPMPWTEEQATAIRDALDAALPEPERRTLVDALKDAIEPLPTQRKPRIFPKPPFVPKHPYREPEYWRGPAPLKFYCSVEESYPPST